MERKFSIWSSYYIDLSPKEMVLEFERNGVRYSELSDEHGKALLDSPDPERAGREFAAFAADHGVQFPQGHLWLGISLCEGEDTLSALLRWIDLYEQIGAERMVLHADAIYSHPEYTSRQRLDANLKQLMKLKQALSGRKAVICLENLIDVCAGAEELMYLVEALQSPNFGVCLDTGHLNLTLRDQKAFIHRCGGALKALHIADNEGETDQHLMPFGPGSVDFPRVFSALDEIGYDGIYNYEIPGERRCPLAMRAQKINYLRAGFQFLCNGAQPE